MGSVSGALIVTRDGYRRILRLLTWSSNCVSCRVCPPLAWPAHGSPQSPAREFSSKADTGDLIQRCTSDIETFRVFISGQSIEIARAVLMLIVVPILFALDSDMAWIALVTPISGERHLLLQQGKSAIPQR